jgi:hypothetical protein
MMMCVGKKKATQTKQKKRVGTRRRSTDGMQLAQVHRDFYFFKYFYTIFMVMMIAAEHV